MDETTKSRWFTRYAWAFVVYLVAVILFGAWVRITHSGAGCGSHWPTCRGQVVPLDPSIETIIEYTHRLTSGLLGLLTVVLVAWAWRVHRWSRVTRAALVSMVLVGFEAAIGAGLVLQELVANDDSVARAVVIALHLANTLILTASAALVAWWSSHEERFDRSEHRGLLWLLVIGLVGIVATSMTGAVTALGDTLFPVDPSVGGGWLQHVRADLSPANHFLVRLRVVHPIVASVVALYLLVVTSVVRARDVAPAAAGWSAVAGILVVLQVLLGLTNIALSAPGWMQLIHLLVAQSLWIAMVLTTVSAMRGGSERTPRGTR